MKLTHCIRYLFVILQSFNTAQAALVGPGDIAFTGWNADSRDAFSFVALTEINPGETIIFTDNEWDGASFNSGEGELSWTANSLVAAGTVVALSDINSSAQLAASTGLASGRINLNASNEGLFALLGSLAAPSSFLTAFASDGAAGFTSLAGTGLSVGLNAIDFNATAAQDADIFAYAGARSGEFIFSDYLAQLNNTSNWLFQGGSGDQSDDGIGPDAPFDNSSFSLQGKVVNVSEPAGLSLLFACAVAITVCNRRLRFGISS